MILNYFGGSNVITKSLIRGSQEGKSERQYVISEAEVTMIQGGKPRNVGSL